MLTLLPIALLLGMPQTPVAPSSAAKPVKTADARDKMVCKRFLETGSLVKGTRVCKSVADWDRDRAEARSSMTGNAGACRSDTGSGC